MEGVAALVGVEVTAVPTAIHRRVEAVRAAQLERAFVERGEIVHDLLDVETIGGAARRLAHAPTSVGILEPGIDRIGKRIGVSGRDQPAGPAFLDEFGEAADAGRDHRTAQGHRLDRDVTEAFPQGGKDDELRARDHCKRIAPPQLAEQMHSVAESFEEPVKAEHELARLVARVAADQNRLDVGMTFEDARQRCCEHLDALPSFQPSEEDEKARRQRRRRS